MLNALTNVRFEGKNGHDAGVTPLPLMTQKRTRRRPLDLPRRKANGLAVIVALGKIGCHAVRRFDTA
jgi:hypothetical protein